MACKPRAHVETERVVRLQREVGDERKGIGLGHQAFWQALMKPARHEHDPREPWANREGVGKMTPVRDYSECIARSLARRAL
jgi:hypothetical protein